MTRTLALDHGTKRCGVAISDPSGTIVSPLSPIRDPDSPAGLDAIREICGESSVSDVVVGLPLSMDGSDSSQTVAARKFAQRLKRSLPRSVTVSLFDERLTTSKAKELGGSAALDSRAAAVLLERWLEAKVPSQ